MHARAPSSAFALVLTLATTVATAQKRDAPMQYGNHLMTTVELGGQAGTTEKGLVIRIPGGATVVFDTELLRMSAAWSEGWVRLRGTAYEGGHGPMPRRAGPTLVETAPGPGWAFAGDFADPRPIPHGPLPKERATYRGFWLRRDDVVVDYRIGDMDVRETYSAEKGPLPIVVRNIEVGPSRAEQRMVVCAAVDSDAQAVPGAEGRTMLLASAPKQALVSTDSGYAWSLLATGGPSKTDWLDPSSGSGATITFVPAFARLHGRKAPANGGEEGSFAVPLLCDGEAADNDDDTFHSVWFDPRRTSDGEIDEGRFLVDLKKRVQVHRVNSFSWHRAERCAQQYELFGSDAEEAPSAAAADPAAAGWKKIADVDTTALDEGMKHGAGVALPGGLGEFRHLLFRVVRGGTFFSEIDVFADRCVSPADTAPRPGSAVAAGLRGTARGPHFVADGGRIVLVVPPHEGEMSIGVAMTAGQRPAVEAAVVRLPGADAVAVVGASAKPMWGDTIVTKGERGADDGPFAVDTITIPFDNRFHSRMRTAAFDFFRDGRAAISTWNGDVWVVSGIDDSLARLEWKRFATGLFDPLGLRIVDDEIFVHGRDGITRLRDTNGDGEADAYECFNHDVNITPAFHEFAFDLQTDREGNFYFSKGGPVRPGGRGFMAIAPHHGTIMKVSKDGSTLETIATGLRAPNGIGVSPTGIVTSGDNEGTYMPRCRLNWIEKPGFYGGVKDTAHRTPVPDQPDLPLCWFPMEVDNSSGGQVWVTGDAWKDLDGRLLHLSYGTCSVFLVLTEKVEGRMQGGVVRLPAQFSSSCMRARFSPRDGQLYVAGFQGWQTSAARDGGFHRVRRTGKPLGFPTGLRTCDKGIYLTFDEPLDPATANDPDSFGVEIWSYLYSANYGSPEVSVLHPERKVEQGKPNRDPLKVTAAKLSPDARTVFLAIDGMRPVNQIQVRWSLDAKDGRELKGELHATIHALAGDPGFPQEH
ncbi:MAG: hypothetical protein JNK78_14750 [Planctomycetes bacterium]|nr:hypothetical protein [Planctomycetota bacterium]